MVEKVIYTNKYDADNLHRLSTKPLILPSVFKRVLRDSLTTLPQPTDESLTSTSYFLDDHLYDTEEKYVYDYGEGPNIKSLYDMKFNAWTLHSLTKPERVYIHDEKDKIYFFVNNDELSEAPLTTRFMLDRQEDMDLFRELYTYNPSTLVPSLLYIRYKDDIYKVATKVTTHYIPRPDKPHRKVYEPVKSLKLMNSSLKNLVDTYLEIAIKKLSNIDKLQDLHTTIRAYRPGSSVKNTLTHIAEDLRNKDITDVVMYKYDFSKYFSSLEWKDVCRSCNFLGIDHMGLDHPYSKFLQFIITDDSNTNLYIGNPITGSLANLIILKPWADSILNLKYKGYTGYIYADDILVYKEDPTSSSNLTLTNVENLLRRNLDKYGLTNITINQRKKKVMKNDKRKFLGYKFGSYDGIIRVNKGIRKKIRAIIHKYVIGKIADTDLPSIEGYINYYLDLDDSLAVERTIFKVSKFEETYRKRRDLKLNFKERTY